MESDLALKLGEMLKACEKREELLIARERAVGEKENLLKEIEESQKILSEKLATEGVQLQIFRDIALERAKTEAIANKNAADAARLADERANWASEYRKDKEDLRVAAEGLSFAKKNLDDREIALSSEEEILKKEKIKHHERVIKDLSEIELKKMRAS